MGHPHDHQPRHTPKISSRVFVVAIAFNLGFVLLEAAFGYWSQALALIADAGHNLSDVLSLLLAWSALWLMQRQPTPNRTYGFRRSSILAALLNAVVLLIAIGGIAWEAIRRLGNPQAIAESTVIWVATAGIVVNTATALLFLAGRKNDLNIRAAFLHMVADAGVSFGVVLSGMAIMATGWLWLDPLASLAIVIVILLSTWGVLRESLNLTLDAVPTTVDMRGVQHYLTTLPGVQSVHDLHVWGISTTETALTAHLIIPDATFTDAFLAQIASKLHDQFHIEHTTLQVETGDANQRCHSCGPIHRTEV